MGSPLRCPSPEYTFDDEGGRPLVEDYGSTNKFRPGQKVYLKVPGQVEPEGPYKIETCAGVRKYTLCSLDGHQPARNGDVVKEDDLTEM